MLLWNPKVKFDESGEAHVAITSSDLPGYYVVVVEGIDGNGNVCSVRDYFDVH